MLKIRKDKQFLLTSLSVVGVGLTLYSAIKDTTKACKIINGKMTFKEKVKKTWKYYIPSFTIATGTILCIIYSDHITQKQKATLLAALATAHNNYNSLRNSIDEVCDDETKQKIYNNITKSKISREDYEDRTDEKIFYEEYGSKMFQMTIEDLLRAEYAFNKQLSIVGMASLNDFYDFLGLPKTDYGERVGWSVYEGYYGLTTRNAWVDFVHSKMESDDGMEYYSIEFNNQPVTNFDMF